MTEKQDFVRSWTEQDRLKAIEAYDILDTPKEEDFEDIVKMASRACRVPIALISFVTSGRQWFKATVGTELEQTPLNVSICSHAILERGLFVIPNTTEDSRTKDNPLVTGEPRIRFYAGALLESPGGLPLGTLCVLDTQPRMLSADESATLKALARQVMAQLELRRALSELRRSLAATTASQKRSNFLAGLTHELSTSAGPDEINRVATSKVATFLGLQRCFFFEKPAQEADQVRMLFDGHAPGENSLEGVYHLDDLGGPAMWQALNHGSVSIEDVRTHAWTRDLCEIYQTANIGGLLITPFSRGGQWVAFMGATSAQPHSWTSEDQSLLEEVTARVWPLLERARTEVALRASEERFRAMSDNIAPLAWMATADGLIFWYNKRWYDYTGSKFEEMQGDGWSRVHDPEHLPHVFASWKQAIVTGLPWEDTFPLRRADGEFRWFLSRAFPIRNAEGRITLWFGVNTDITELRDAQNALREANTLLGDRAALLESIVQQRTQKLSETIGELEAFSYSISHDMRAPLRAMIGFSEMLKEDHSSQLDASGLDYLKRISTASRRMDQLIQDVLVFSKLSREEVVLTTVNTDSLVREIIHSYPNLHPDIVGISISGLLPGVKGSEALLTQCFSNLMENGAKFVEPGTKPQMKVWGETENGRVQLYFKDNGIGIPENHLKRVFEIFQRVGRDNKGTGIGLAIVRKAVEKMGGTLGLKSELGKGSLFWLDLQTA